MAAVLALLLLAAPGPATGIPLDPRKAITQYVHAVWGTEEGLPQNSFLAILQTRDGYLWLGTQEGLVRFDGVRFVVFDNKNTPEFRHSYVCSLLEDREGSLWIGTVGGGLSRLTDGKFTAFTAKEGLLNDNVRSLHQDREGKHRALGRHPGGPAGCGRRGPSSPRLAPLSRGHDVRVPPGRSLHRRHRPTARVIPRGVRQALAPKDLLRRNSRSFASLRMTVELGSG